MARVIWIASYPKSGNTWVRFLIANLFYKEIENSADVHRLVPDIHRHISAAHLLGNRLTFIKTHWKYHDRLPLREDAIGAIYIVRNPLDVISSNLNYFILRQGAEFFAESEEKQKNACTAYVDSFIEKGGADDWIRLGMGTWPENVESWYRHEMPFPILRVRYEDMKQDPSQFLEKLCGLIGSKRSSERIEAAVRRSSFDSLRQIEEREIENNTPGIFTSIATSSRRPSSIRFMHRGQTDGYHGCLTEKQIEAAMKRFHPQMVELGYDGPGATEPDQEGPTKQ